MLRADLAETYDAFETPRAERGELEFLGPDEAREYLGAVRRRVLELFDGHSDIHEMVLRHEQQHNETMLQTIQLARMDGYSLRAGASLAHNGGPPPTGLELIEIPAGGCTIGAPSEGFAYDNERPRHRTDVRGYLIGRTPVTNATYLRFVEGGGYERREWWSEEGWSWKEQYDITRPAGWTADLQAEWRLSGFEPLDPHRAVVHISWFEADAFTRAHGARLPTEIEWEKAATWNQATGAASPFPWGSDLPVPGIHGNVDQIDRGPGAADGHAAGASPYGCLAMIGDVWEWTASEFRGYPGFHAHPYREYSEVFFGPEYRVLRGGSWATAARMATPTFRNWDYPERRQIFAGLRIASDL
jgi:iron(II)-dependent oxidoreductase